MKTGTNRLRRKDQTRFVCGRSERRRRLARRAAAALVAAALAIGAAAPARASTGGASTVVAADAQTGTGIVFTPMRWAGATWYGPGFYGSRTACGTVLRPDTIGVAHRNLPCGTTVKFAFEGRQIVTTVIDRGPFSGGNSWDLTNGARRLLGFDGSGQIGYAISMQYARHGHVVARSGR